MQRGLQALIWHSGRAWLGACFHLSWLGREHLPEPPYLLASNHVSHLDGPAIIAAHGKGLSGVYSLAARDYFFDHWLKGWLVKVLFNLIPFSRRRSFRECLPICRSVLAEHKVILMFPEGTRSPQGNLLPFKNGLGFIARELAVPIVPVYITGSYQALPKGQRRWPQRYPIQVRFGAPVSTSQYSQTVDSQTVDDQTTDSRQAYREIVEAVRLSIEHLRDEHLREQP